MRKTRTFGHSRVVTGGPRRPIHNRKTRTGGHYSLVTEGPRLIHNEEDEDWRSLESSDRRWSSSYIMRKTRTGGH